MNLCEAVESMHRGYTVSREDTKCCIVYTARGQRLRIISQYPYGPYVTWCDVEEASKFMADEGWDVSE